MNGRESCKFGRERWERTPLERIQDSIDEVTRQVKLEEERIDGSMEQPTNQYKRVNQLKKGVEILKIEAAKRRERECYLHGKRDKLMRKLSKLRHKSKGESEQEFEKLVEKIKSIDDQLGPFRWSKREFHLE